MFGGRFMYVKPLPYAKDALMPFLSPEAIDLHYEKHHKGYGAQLSALIKDNPQYQNLLLEDIIKKSHAENNTGIFNNAAQIYNHNFLWASMCPKHLSQLPDSGPFFDAITKSFSSMECLAEKLVETAMKQFGSGWVWMMQHDDGTVFIEKTSNAFVPWIKEPSDRALFVCDVWEHAYYVNYQNRRKEYVQTFFKHINWDFAAQNFQPDAA
jgi:Fe-Mn family superoxide dismutase